MHALHEKELNSQFRIKTANNSKRSMSNNMNSKAYMQQEERLNSTQKVQTQRDSASSSVDEISPQERLSMKKKPSVSSGKHVHG